MSSSGGPITRYGDGGLGQVGLDWYNKGDADEDVYLRWSWCLGLAWLGLEVSETFSRLRSFHCCHFYYFCVEGFVERWLNFKDNCWPRWMLRRWSERDSICCIVYDSSGTVNIHLILSSSSHVSNECITRTEYTWMYICSHHFKLSPYICLLKQISPVKRMNRRFS